MPKKKKDKSKRRRELERIYNKTLKKKELPLNNSKLKEDSFLDYLLNRLLISGFSFLLTSLITIFAFLIFI